MNKKEIRELISFFELPTRWQAEAIENHGLIADAQEQTYIKPLSYHLVGEHYLLDLSDCMRVDDSEFDGVITISNTSAIGVKIIDDETVELTYI